MEQQGFLTFDPLVTPRRPRAAFQPLDWADEAFGALSVPSSTHGSVAMVQPLLADLNRVADYRQPDSWALQPTEQGNMKSSGAAVMSQGSSYLPRRNLTGTTGMSDSFDWVQTAYQAEPFVMDPFDYPYSQSNDALFGPLPNQNAAAGGFSYARSNEWPTLKPNSLPHGASNTSPNTAMYSSVSTKSSFSDELDHYSNPGSFPTPSQASPVSYWQSISSSPSKNALPSPSDGSYVAATTAELAALTNAVNEAFQSSSMLSGSQYTKSGRFEHDIVENTQPASNGYDLPYDPVDSSGAHAYYTESNVEGHDSYPQVKSETQDSYPQVKAEEPASPTESTAEAQLPVVRAPLTQAERDYNDQVLLECKKRGETYKEIRNKLLGERPAESTLRGRYRSLTKARGERVRKPVWTRVDINLLMQFVHQELQRIRTQVHNADTLTIRQKLTRVSWKTVADSIKSHGGSYHFGVTTCKKKWIELNLPADTSSAPTDGGASTATLQR